MCVNVELHYWELELELVSNQCLSLQFITDLSLPNWAVIILYFRHWHQPKMVLVRKTMRVVQLLPIPVAFCSRLMTDSDILDLI